MAGVKVGEAEVSGEALRLHHQPNLELLLSAGGSRRAGYKVPHSHRCHSGLTDGAALSVNIYSEHLKSTTPASFIMSKENAPGMAIDSGKAEMETTKKEFEDSPIDLYIDPAEEKAVVKKLDRVIMPLMAIVYFFQCMHPPS